MPVGKVIVCATQVSPQPASTAADLVSVPAQRAGDFGVEDTNATRAPVETVWPWIAQIGQDRGAFYSYAWLENLAGCRLRNADHIHPD